MKVTSTSRVTKAVRAKKQIKLENIFRDMISIAASFLVLAVKF